MEIALVMLPKDQVLEVSAVCDINGDPTAYFGKKFGRTFTLNGVDKLLKVRSKLEKAQEKQI